MTIELQPFDAATYLTDDESIGWFLEAALEDGDVADFVRALRTVSRAKTIPALAEAAGMSETELQKVLDDGEHANFVAVIRIIGGLGLRFAVTERSAAKSDAA